MRNGGRGSPWGGERDPYHAARWSADRGGGRPAAKQLAFDDVDLDRLENMATARYYAKTIRLQLRLCFGPKEQAHAFVTKRVR
jgi:hypothetical protein